MVVAPVADAEEENTTDQPTPSQVEVCTPNQNQEEGADAKPTPPPPPPLFPLSLPPLIRNQIRKVSEKKALEKSVGDFCFMTLLALNLRIAIGATWPILLGGRTQWTVGLVATLVSFSSIIAADTYAFLGGKTFGRTPLTSISPKKTWEGAIAGLSGCIATALVLSKIFSLANKFTEVRKDSY
ncbi:hypothetical protein IFM89_016557 [Coptis chinensis]|uniref:phosphatidate cytidylyltransferase n=1 Tax=Coptis chinensis TaxID=261450 RepID=A0A835IA26_9MAGN|nr:hypothetical protein IFM89_016557 [Coptis chinensis]